MTSSSNTGAPVQVVTDGTADLPAETARTLGIDVVPLYVHFGDEQLRGGVDISNEQFYERMKSSKELPRTSQPAPADFVSVYEAAVERGPVLSLHVTAKLSGTYNSALLARQEVLQRNPEAQIAIVDTQQISMVLGLLVTRAVERAKAGDSLGEIVDWVQTLIPRTRTIFVLDTLENLEKGGRLGRGQAFLGGLLKVKPLLEIREGEVHPRERARSRKKALERLVQLALAEGPAELSVVAGSTDLEAARDVAAQLCDGFGHADVPVFNIGPVIGTYAGPGCVGVGIIKSDNIREP
jgi:DegV family protein with EDD domain